MKSNYDQLASVLRLWYSDEQIEEIWAMLKDYDAKLMDQTKITEEYDSKKKRRDMRRAAQEDVQIHCDGDH